MREFELKVEDAFKKGLRTREDNPRNHEALVECYNAKPSVGGVIPFEPITDPFASATISWPFPQLFIGRNYRIYCTLTQIYQLSTWTLGTVKITTTGSGRWDFIDFGSYFILVNGAKLVIIDPDDESYTASNSLTNIPRFATGCAFRGRIVGGNIKTTWHGAGVNDVIWSKVGEANFTPDKTNTAGIMPMFWEGEVLRVMTLGKSVIVYGDNGVAQLYPSMEPTPTFGMNNILDVGIPAKAAVDGNERVHVFVDTNNWLWRWQDGKAPEKLGYQEFMDNLTAANIVVSYDARLGEFFISDSSTCYLLTPYGLCEVYQLPTTVQALDGTTYGVFTDTEDYEFRAKVDTLDFGIRGFKTVGMIELGIYHPATVGATSIVASVSTEIRNTKTSTFAQTGKGWLAANPNGFAYLGITADDFRLQVKTTRFESVNLSYIKPHVKVVDRRAIRGVYSMQAYAESK